MKRGFIKLFIISIFAIIPQVSFGAVVYDNSTYEGATVNVGASGDYFNYAPGGATVSPLVVTTFTVNSAFTILRVKRLSGNACSNFTTYSAIRNSSNNDFAITSVSVVGDYCDFSISGSPQAGQYKFPYLDSTNNSSMVLDANTTVGNSFNGAQSLRVSGGFNFQLCDSGGCSPFAPPIPDDTSTRIISMTPEDNATTTSPVDFSLHYYISPEDVGTINKITVSFHNIDQNTLFGGLTQFFNPNDIIFILHDVATSSGEFTYSSSSIPLADGNYRIHGALNNSILGILPTPFGVHISLDHQFVVGQETFIGHISQSSFEEIQSFYASTTATSTVALGTYCNPISGFEIGNCMAYLLIPSGEQVKDTIDSLKDGILLRVPWGYMTRFVSIISSTATTSLPTYTNTIMTSATASTTLSFDPGEMISGGAQLLATIEDPVYHKTVREITEPLAISGLALAVLMTIVFDLARIRREDKNKKYA